MGDWLTILIIFLILGILLDGWRRMRNAQKDSLKVSRSVSRSSARPSGRADEYSAELPNGGARVVGYRASTEDDDGEAPDVTETPEPAPQEPEPLDSDEPAPRAEEEEPPATEPDSEPDTPPERGRIPEQVALNLDESVPILMETEEQENEDGRIEPTFGAATDSGKSEPAGEAAGRKASAERDPESPRRQAASPEHSRKRAAHRDPPPEPRAATPEPPPEPEEEPVPPEPEEVLIVNVMAPGGQQFRGDALLDALISAGLRYGDMNIFHRYQGPRGAGPIWFSLANMVKPGTFDLDAMEDFTTPGVSLFMTLPLERRVEPENVEVFDEMLEAARSMAVALGGELKDENRSVMTRQTQEHCRQRIHEFERKQLSRAPH